jgi:predicted site-specific integrase-resolvase
LRTVSGLVARVSRKIDVPGRTEAAVAGRTIAYCRVSSRDQNPQLQLDALHAHGYDQLFAEKQSGVDGTFIWTASRPVTRIGTGS